MAYVDGSAAPHRAAVQPALFRHCQKPSMGGICVDNNAARSLQSHSDLFVKRQNPRWSAAVPAQAALVVYDEIHYLRDKERGVVWEESIVLAPRSVRFAFLSATIPNALEFAQWIAKTHGCGPLLPALCCALRPAGPLKIGLMV